MNNNNNNNNKYIGGRVGNNYCPTQEHIRKKSFFLNSLLNKTYINIYYLLNQKNFFYKGEVEKILNFRIDYYINKLLEENIIKQIKNKKEYSNLLYDLEGFNYKNVSLVKIYIFTSYGKNIILKFNNYIQKEVDHKIKSNYEKTIYNLEYKKIRDELKFKILTKKIKSMLTVEDLIFIDKYKKENEKY